MARAKSEKATIDLKPRVISKGERAIGPGKADLLEHIDAAGSISAAARAMGMSYSRAWALVDVMNRAFKQPLVESATGGARGGGATLTGHGREVLALYRAMQATLDAAAARFTPEFDKKLK